MTDTADERARLVEVIMSRTTQPTLLDAAAVIKFDLIQEVYALLELDGQLRASWWERKGSVFSWE